MVYTSATTKQADEMLFWVNAVSDTHCTQQRLLKYAMEAVQSTSVKTSCNRC